MSIEIYTGGRNDPLGVVKKGIDQYHSQPSKYDIVLCLIDRDCHTNFNQAMARAREFSNWLATHRLKVHRNTTFKAIASYPCFEIWLLFHYLYTRRSFAGSGPGNTSPCSQVISHLSNNGIRGYGKGATGIYSHTKSNLDTALQHSRQAKNDVRVTQRANPSTDVHKIFEILRDST